MGPRAKRGAAKEAAAAEESKKAKSGLVVGDELPKFELQNDEEQTVSAADLVKDGGIVLFAYPKANTKGCTSQAVGLSEKADELAAAGYKVYGISADKPKSQANWRSKEGISFNLLCDPSHEVLGKLGFSSGKKINRSHIVVAKGGKVLDVHYGITPKNSVKDAVEFCLANKGEPLPGAEAQPAADKEAAAEKAEEAAAAGEAAEKAEEAAAAGEAAEKAEEAAAEEAADEKEEAGDNAAAMDVDEPAAEDKPAEDEAAAEAKPEEAAAVEAEEKSAEKAAEEPAADEKTAEAPAEGEADKKQEEQPAAEEAVKPAEEVKAGEATAAAEDKPAAEEPAAAAAEEPAAAEAPTADA